MTAARRRHLALTLLLMLLAVAAEMITIGAVLPFFALIADSQSALLGPRLREWLAFAGGDPLIGAAILLTVAALTAGGIRLLLALSVQTFVMKLGHEMAAAVFSQMLRQPYAMYLRRNSSEVLSGVEKVNKVVFGVIQPAMQGIIAAVMGLLMAALLFVIDPMAASIGAVSVILAYAAMSGFTRYRLHGNAQAIGVAMTERTKIVQEGLGGIRDITLERSQPLFEKRFRAVDLRYRRALAGNALIAASPRFVVEAAAIVVIAVVTVAISAKPGGILAAMPVLAALALGAQRLLPLIQTAWQGWSQAAGNLQLLHDVGALFGAQAAPPGPAAQLPFKEELVLDAVSFAYEEEGPFALRDLSLRIRRGERVGITGATGSGKSTLLDLVMGLLQPSEGKILIDGRRLDSATIAAWQATIAHVPQSVYLADDTIAANIAFAAPGGVDIARVEAAARAACIASFVEALPEGYQTRIGERGVLLSGGQRQRIGIARALYKRASVLFLDEATNALDEQTEAAVLRSLSELPGELTLVVVAHRRSTVSECDRVLQLEHGTLVKCTTPAPA